MLPGLTRERISWSADNSGNDDGDGASAMSIADRTAGPDKRRPGVSKEGMSWLEPRWRELPHT